MSGTLHRRIRASLSTLDAFPKTEDTYQTRTTSGGILTLVLTLFLAVLTLAEFADYRRLEQKYEFLVDQSSGNAKHKLQINVDVTLAMKCEYLTLDVVDVGGTSLHVKHALRSDASTFSVQDSHQLGEGSADPLDIHRLIKQAQKSSKKNYGAGEGIPGCRVYGSFDVNKVMGNLHITALGHGYGGHHVPHNAINFTHRVDKLSFGLDYPGLVNPLDNSVEIAKENFQQFQYYISVVPTIYIDYSGTVLLTSQYAVTDYKRTISHDGGTGLPGIFFKYDIEAILVRISETRPTFLQFLVRVCGIVGGLFATAGMAHKIAGSVLQQTRKVVEEKGSSNFR